MRFLTDLGVSKERLRYRDHEAEELSFYSNATTDIEFDFPWGFGELWGIASRTDYDLKAHQTHSKVNMEYLDPETNERYLPYVVEPSVGVARLLLAVLFSAYDEEEISGKESRIVLRLNPVLAPYKVAVLPLIKKRHSEKAQEVLERFSEQFSTTYDDTANIGKRYRRQDAIGTPFCVTIDDETLEKGTVTVRHRDSMAQTTLSVEEALAFIGDQLNF